MVTYLKLVSLIETLSDNKGAKGPDQPYSQGH